MERICVFLSSKANLPENYVQAAIDVATWIGKSGRTLVYGGSRVGLMETLATTVRENGGRVIGVVPQAVVNRDLVSDASTTVFYTADLQDRKSFRERYLQPALALGLIEYSRPDKPNSRLQKYRLTELGRALQ